MKKILLTLHLAFLTSLLFAQVTTFPFIESFENETFPPENWQTYPVVAGDMDFERVVEGSWPDCLPFDGDAMVSYNSFSASAGEEALLITPELMLTSDNIFRFWFFRSEDPSNNRADRIEVYYNDTDNLEGATLLDSVYRAINFYPEVVSEGWYQYSFSFDHPGSTYIIIRAISGYGWRMYLDKVEVDVTSIDEDPPEISWIEGRQEYAETEMNLVMRATDISDMPELLNGVATIEGVANNVELNKISGGNGVYDYEVTLAAQPNHTTGTLVIDLIDIHGNEAVSDSYDISWDWQKPIFDEDFEGEDFPPLGWIVEGMPATWLTWDDYGLVYYTDSDGNYFEVYPEQGERQAALEWNFQNAAQNEWMISPAVEIDEGAVLTFNQFVFSGAAQWNDEYLVVASTDGFNWNTIWDANDYPVGYSDYSEKTIIDLDEYIGETIRVAWHAYNNTGSNIWYSWFVDDIRIMPKDSMSVSVPNLETNSSSLFPNPCKNHVVITCDNLNSKIKTVSLFDIGGQEVKTFGQSQLNSSNGKVTISVSNLPKGFYLYQIVSDSGIYSGKLIKE